MTDEERKALVGRLRNYAEWVEPEYDYAEAPTLTAAADQIEADAARIAALEALVRELEALTEKLIGYAGHDDGCQIMTHGVWSDPIPCTCGYSDVAAAALQEKNDG